MEEFLRADAPRTKASEGQRAQLSAKYVYGREIQASEFAATFPNTAVCDLAKEHLDTFIGSPGHFSAKSRNHYHAAIRQFLLWGYRIHQCGAFFVTRAKQNFRCARRYSPPVDKTTGLRFDQTVVLPPLEAQHDYPAPLRRIG